MIEQEVGRLGGEWIRLISDIYLSCCSFNNALYFTLSFLTILGKFGVKNFQVIFSHHKFNITYPGISPGLPIEKQATEGLISGIARTGDINNALACGYRTTNFIFKYGRQCLRLWRYHLNRNVLKISFCGCGAMWVFLEPKFRRNLDSCKSHTV
jgi:hypothetical protein